jgi:hypothetical protein
VTFTYHAPGYLDDFSPVLLEEWNTLVSAWFDASIAGEPQSPLAFVNQARTPLPGAVIEQSIVWNALPGTLVNRYGRAQALALADYPYPLTRSNESDAPGGLDGIYRTEGLANCWYRPQDEYCEWHVKRDVSGKIIEITFSSEPPEYWQALHGDTLTIGDTAYQMSGDPQLVLELYRQYVSPEVQLADLEFQADVPDDSGNVLYRKGQYNPFNRWNTVDGIMHLSHPANYLQAEIQLGSDASVVYGRAGRRITNALDLITAAAYGGTNRTSDPTIGSSVQSLAALGCTLSLRDPVGLYMHHLNLAPFATPDGSPVTADYFRVVRGDASASLIERAVFAVPEGLGFTVSDLLAGGEPVAFGAQVAEHVTVHLVAVASAPGSVPVSPRPPNSAGAVLLQPATDVQYQSLGTAPAPPRRPVFAAPPMTDLATPGPAAARTAAGAAARLVPRASGLLSRHGHRHLATDI